jgi:hydroxypyruvate reductase
MEVRKVSEHVLKNKALEIIRYAIAQNSPENAVKKAIKRLHFEKPLLVIAIGKAAWRMAKAVTELSNITIAYGIVLTKYGHSEGNLRGFDIYEAGHPLVDNNSLKATQIILDTVARSPLTQEILFLLSGGGSALFESPIDGIGLDELKSINDHLIKSGASIQETNTIRKRLSKVKGGRFALFANPRNITALVLSDTIGNRLDTIASGPVSDDNTTVKDALKILKKYSLNIPPRLMYAFENRVSVPVTNVTAEIIGNVQFLCSSAKTYAEKSGFATAILTTQFDGQISECARFLCLIGKEIVGYNRPFTAPAAVFIGGEAVVHIRGKGKGGRCQEMAMHAAKELRESTRLCFFAVGSDGTDGPTDAAGGIVDGRTFGIIEKYEPGFEGYLSNNDSFNALRLSDSLIVTGPTGTNVNDLYGILVE